ncbi:MAG: hypothetical protein KBG15_07525 [Kofleriaceae bacterium]|nr:hypothetical protein [Kofleriaceae bacterium]
MMLYPPSALQQRLEALVKNWPIDAPLGPDAAPAYRAVDVTALANDLDAQRTLLSDDFETPAPGAVPSKGSALTIAAQRFADAPAVWLAALWMRWLWQRNQFTNIDEIAIRALVAEAEQLLVGNASQFTMAAHRRRLVILLADIVGGNQRIVTASRYSPELVLRALGFGSVTSGGVGVELVGPLLDVGCGDGSLVQHVRKLGLAARGIDRDPAPPGERADWLSFDFAAARWATIISHHGFSLFFRHADLVSDASAPDYARAYMRMLAALQVGGRFAYYPTLPFIETLLPSRYRVSYVPLPADLAAAAQMTDDSLPSEACHIVRL